MKPIGNLVLLCTTAPVLLATRSMIASNSPQIEEVLPIAAVGWGVVGGGLLSGCLHALCGPDHLAALMPLIIGRSFLLSCSYGLVWGLGHSLSSCLLGLSSYGGKSALTIFSFPFLMDYLNSMMNVIVGCTLMVIGAMGVREALQSLAETESEETDSTRVDESANNAETGDQGFVKKLPTKESFLAVLLNGVLLGASLDSLPSLAPGVAVGNTRSLLTYLLCYSIGTFLTMMVLCGTIGEISYRYTRRVESVLPINFSEQNKCREQSSAGSDTLQMGETKLEFGTLAPRLALVSSLVAFVIGAVWILSAVVGKLGKLSRDIAFDKDFMTLEQNREFVNNDGGSFSNYPENDGSMGNVSVYLSSNSSLYSDIVWILVPFVLILLCTYGAVVRELNATNFTYIRCQDSFAYAKDFVLAFLGRANLLAKYCLAQCSLSNFWKTRKSDIYTV